MQPYAGPALLSGTATGLIFHEAIGHRPTNAHAAAHAGDQSQAGVGHF